MRRLLALLTISCASCNVTAPAAPPPPMASVLPLPPPAAGKPTPPAPQPKPSPAAATDERIEPCRDGTPGHAEASAALEALGIQIEALPAIGDPKPANQGLADLLRHPCMAGAAIEQPGDLSADSAYALKTWWEHGGRWWLESYLALWNVDADRLAIVGIDMPSTLTLDHRPDHPLAPVLCKHDDAACGSATQGWLRRAEAFFSMAARVDREGGSHMDACETAAAQQPEHERFSSWWACWRGTVRPRAAFPLGRFEAPSDGWFVVRGRRGHHGFCDEIRAYSLETGAFYAAKSCGGLQLRSDGSVDHQKTGATRKPEQQVGRLPLDALREAALMTMLAEDAEREGVWEGWGRSVPKGYAVSWPGGMGIGLGGFGWGSGQTTLSWTWIRNGKQQHHGELVYPDNDNEAARDHAVKLLLIAEAGTRFGCAPSRLPALPAHVVPSVSGLDANAQQQRDTYATLGTALREASRDAVICR